MIDHQQFVLVVDDEPLNRKSLALCLEKEGFCVLTAGDGHEALALLQRRSVDLVLLDLIMPELSGLEALRAIRQWHSTTALPVIMVTAVSESESLAEMLEAGANDYITKPIDFTIALARIRAQLRDKRRVSPKETSLAAPIGPGVVFANKYYLEEKIGSGGFGAIYRASHLDLKRTVAVKVLQSDKLPDPVALARFQIEGISTAQLQHPNIVSVMDFGALDGGVVFLVMEMLKGCNLEDELTRKRPLPPKRCIEILLPICDALSIAHHKGIIHRDIKPSNIFLHRAPQGEVPKLLDFGLAKLLSHAAVHENITTEGCILGTLGYLAPERLRNEPYDGRVDVYSLGVTLYEMLAGRPPFVSTSQEPMALAMMHLNEEPLPPSSWVPDIPPQLEEVVMSALSKYPLRRPNIDELAQRLSRATEKKASHQAQAKSRASLYPTPIYVAALPAEASPNKPPLDGGAAGSLVKKNGKPEN